MRKRPGGRSLAWPRCPFDSDYKFMATFHDRPSTIHGPVVSLPHFVAVKGGPMSSSTAARACCRAARSCPWPTCATRVLDANRQLSEQGLRVLAFAAKGLDDAAMDAARTDPMAAVDDLVLVGLVGIIDPLRPEAAEAVRQASAPASMCA